MSYDSHEWLNHSKVKAQLPKKVTWIWALARIKAGSRANGAIGGGPKIREARNGATWRIMKVSKWLGWAPHL